MIIDCHCHAGKGDLLTGPWDTDAPVETYLKRTQVAGINKTIIFYQNLKFNGFSLI